MYYTIISLFYFFYYPIEGTAGQMPPHPSASLNIIEYYQLRRKAAADGFQLMIMITY